MNRALPILPTEFFGQFAPCNLRLLLSSLRQAIFWLQHESALIISCGVLKKQEDHEKKESEGRTRSQKEGKGGGGGGGASRRPVALPRLSLQQGPGQRERDIATGRDKESSSGRRMEDEIDRLEDLVCVVVVVGGGGGGGGGQGSRQIAYFHTVLHRADDYARLVGQGPAMPQYPVAVTHAAGLTQVGSSNRPLKPLLMIPGASASACCSKESVSLYIHQRVDNRPIGWGAGRRWDPKCLQDVQ